MDEKNLKALGEAIDSVFDQASSNVVGAAGMTFTPDGKGGFTTQDSPTFVTELEAALMADEEEEEMEEAAGSTWKCEECGMDPCVVFREYDSLIPFCEIMDNDPDMTNTTKRYHLYRFFSMACHGPLGKGNREELPACVSREIHDMYPAASTDGYTGFREAADK